MTNLHRSGPPTGFNGGPILLRRIYKSLPIDWNGEKRKYHVMRSDTRSLFGQSIHVIRSEEEVLLNGPLWLTATAHILGGRKHDQICSRIPYFWVNSTNQKHSRREYQVLPTAKICSKGNICRREAWLRVRPNFDVQIPTGCHRKTLKVTAGAIKPYKMSSCCTLSEGSKLICRKRGCQLSQCRIKARSVTWIQVTFVYKGKYETQ